ncbi:MAG: type III pantothenate kinase, partial [Clostridia bacterium]|nr:type III pantothenate kinase [Clostridia bacterium]
MLFTADIGARTITLGAFDGETLRFRASLSASRGRTADEYAVLLSRLFDMHDVPPQAEGAVLSSVSKPLNAVIAQAVEQVCGVRPVFLGPGVRTGLDIRADVPSQLGGDIAACCIGALRLQKPPLAVLGFGAATTLAYL